MKKEEERYPDLEWGPQERKKANYAMGAGLFIVVGWVAFLLTTLAPSCPSHKTSEYYFNYGMHYMSENDFIQAERFLTRAIKESPRYYEAYAERAKAWEMSDSIRNAISDYDTLLTFSLTVDKTAGLYFKKANMYYLLSEDTLSCRDLRKACDLNHNKACDLIRTRCK